MNESNAATLTKSNSKFRAAHEEFLFPCVKPLYNDPITIVDASGMNVIDVEGVEYLDFFAGILTTGIGH